MNLRKLTILVILLLVWVFLSFLYLYQYVALTLIEQNPQNVKILQFPRGEFLQGQRMEAEFTSTYNFMGLVGIRFYNFKRINGDSVTFRIREKGQKEWYYHHTFTTDQFQPDAYFSFGFPIINDSKDKRYEIEVESVDGRPENAIGFSTVRPLITTSYQYPKQLIFSNIGTLKNFIIVKIGGTSHLGEFILSIVIYLNFMILSLFLTYLFISRLLEKQKVRVTGASIVMVGIILLVLSSFVLYLRKPELSIQITSAAFILLLTGMIIVLIKNMINKNS